MKITHLLSNPTKGQFSDTRFQHYRSHTYDLNDGYGLVRASNTTPYWFCVSIQTIKSLEHIHKLQPQMLTIYPDLDLPY